MMEKIKKILKSISLTPLYSLLLSFIIGAVLILATGNNPIEIYSILVNGAIGSPRSILQSFLQTTPLLFAGLSVYIGMQAGLLNLGVEGQLHIGALLSTIVAIYVSGLPPILHILLSILAGFVGGALWAFIPIFLKVKRGAHEVVTALMMNYIAILFVDFMLNYPLKDPNSSIPQTIKIADSAKIYELIPRSNVTIAIIIGILLVVLFKFFFDQTKKGYEIKLVGANQLSAMASGVDINRILIQTMLISGGIAGLVGTFEILGVYERLIVGFSSGYGFEGVAVAVLGSSPLSVIFSALLFGALKAGGIMLNYGTNLSSNFIQALQGLVILIVSAPFLITNIRKRLFKKEGITNE